MDVNAYAHRTAVLGPQSAHGRVANIATIVQIHQDAKLGVQQILTTGIPNANGEVARSATAAMPPQAPQRHLSAKLGAQPILTTGMPNANGEVAGSATAAMPPQAPQSHLSAKNGARETAMIGVRSAHGKVAGNAAIATKIAVSRAARQTRLPKARQFWFDCIYTSLAQCCRCSF